MKIGIKTLMALAMGLMIAGSSVGLAADASTGASNKASTQKNAKGTEKTEKVSFLFVLQAKQGTLTKNKDGHFTLTLKHKDVNNVIEFSDRPYRIVKYITADRLKNSWAKGTNSFESDPPNAVLMAKGHKAQIIVLRGITVNNETVTFDVNLTDRSIGSLKNRLLENISLVIDECRLATGRCKGSDLAHRWGDLHVVGIVVPVDSQ